MNIPHFLFIHLYINGRLDCFHLLIIVSNVAVNIGYKYPSPYFELLWVNTLE